MEKINDTHTNTVKKRKQNWLKSWFKKLDGRDKSLCPAHRRNKWVLILAILFLLFVFSFIWLPPVEFFPKEPEKTTLKIEIAKKNNPGAQPFDMPVDSFENHLKRNIHENTAKKE